MRGRQLVRALECRRWRPHHSRRSVLCTTVLFWICWRWIINPTRVVARDGHVCSRHRLARTQKGHSNISPDWDVLCGGRKRANLSYWPLAWRPTTASIAFTAIASVLGLLTFGSLTLLRRIWPQQPANDKAPPSNKTRVSPEVQDVFRKLHRLMDNEKAQNERLPEPYRSDVLRGADCDEIAGAVGEFGRDPRNPIPVNGPLGELIYLSNLRTADSQPIMFHCLGTISNVDIFETVSLDGARWDILFLHQYHPRKSQRTPSGYRIVTGTVRNSLLLGVNNFVAAFPDDLANAIASMSERLFSFRIRPPQVREALGRAIFERPTDHLTRLDIILGVLKRQALTAQDAT